MSFDVERGGEYRLHVIEKVAHFGSPLDEFLIDYTQKEFRHDVVLW
jgi:hypothetical protein